MKYSYGLSCVLFVAACATSDAANENPNENADDNVNVDDATDPPVSSADPANVTAPAQTDQAGPAGFPIPAPSLSTGGSSTATVATSFAGAGLQIDGGTEPAAYALATYMINTGAVRATGQFTVNPASGASFTYALRGTGGGYSSRYTRVQRVPGSDALQAVSANGAVTCGPLPSGQPTAVTLSYDGAAQTFDVLIAGQPTACSHLPTKTSGPITGIRVVDEAIEGYGGHVELTNLALSASP